MAIANRAFASGREATLDFRRFKGLNLSEPPGLIDDEQLSECVNLNVGNAGELVKRNGFSLLSQSLGLNPVTILGHYLTDTVSQLFAAVGPSKEIWYSPDGANWTDSGQSGGDWAVQYAGKLYVIRSAGTVLQWDGAAWTNIVGSPSGTFGLVFKDRLYILNSKASGTLNSRLYYSEIADFSTTGWGAANFLDVRPGDGDFLTCCAVLHDVLILFKTKSTWGLYVTGLPDQWGLRLHNAAIGCVSKFTPREIEGSLYFVGRRSVYRTDGLGFVDISRDIYPVLQSRIINLTNANLDSAAWWEDKYIVLLHPDPSTNRYLVYNLRTGTWTEWIPEGITPSYFLEVYTGQPSRGLYCGDLNSVGKVYRYEPSVYTDAGNLFPVTLATKEFDFGRPSLTKRGKWGQVEADSVGSITCTYSADGRDLPNTPLPVGEGRRSRRMKGPGFFRTLKITLTETTQGPFIFYSMSLILHLKRQVSKETT